MKISQITENIHKSSSVGTRHVPISQWQLHMRSE